jgi:plastocyanin
MPSIASPRSFVAAGLLTAALAAAGCGSDDSTGGGPAAQSGKVTVAYKDFAIAPEKLTVKAGTTITWTNADGTRHNVITKPGAPSAFKSKDFDKGQTVTFTPTKPGVYPYLCTFHPATMQGIITVVE